MDRSPGFRRPGFRLDWPIDSADEAVAAARDGSDIAWSVRRVIEGAAEFVDRGIQRVLEFNEGVRRPEFFAEFLAGDDFAGAFLLLASCSPAWPTSASPTGFDYAVQSFCWSSGFQRTANSVVTDCLSRGVHSTWPPAGIPARGARRVEFPDVHQPDCREWDGRAAGQHARRTTERLPAIRLCRAESIGHGSSASHRPLASNLSRSRPNLIIPRAPAAPQRIRGDTRSLFDHRSRIDVR